MAADGLEQEMMALRLARKERAADDIHLFEFRRPDGGELPAFSGGAHVSVRVPNGLTRKYSLCSNPAETDRYVIAVKRESAGRGGSVSLVDDAREGDVLDVAPPRNDFALVKSPAGYLFIAGGIGITPIMAMMRELEASGGRFKLYYCTRSAETTAFRDEFAAPEFRGKVVIHHDGGDPARSLDLWPLLEKPKGHVYCCGPRALMQTVRDMTGHWSASSVHFEAFTEPARETPDDVPFTVRLARSGEAIEVPVGTTMLEALRATGHQVPSSCESGTCGTCRTRLVSGEADHRDLVLADYEHATNIMLCVSRGRGELVIDR